MPVLNSDLYRAFARLGTRLRLKDQPARTGVSSDVVAVTDFDELLRDVKALASTQDISAGSGSTTFFTVPAGKRWRILRIEAPALSAGSHVFFQVGGQNVDLYANSSTTQFLVGNGDPLNQGDLIRMVNTGNAGDSSRELVTYYTEEESY